MIGRICALIILFFSCSEGVNVSCVPDSCSRSGSSLFCNVCNASATVGEDLQMVCKVSSSSIGCVEAIEESSWGNNLVNIGSVVGWLWLAGRGVYKLFHTSPREDYMRGKLQRVLSSELLGALITFPSVASIVFEFTDVGWGDYLVNGAPLLVGGVQVVYDIIKSICSCQRGHKEKLFFEFIDQLEKDLVGGDDARCCLLTRELFEWAKNESEELGIWSNVYVDENTQRSREVLFAFRTLLIMNCRNAENDLQVEVFEDRSMVNEQNDQNELMDV